MGEVDEDEGRIMMTARKILFFETVRRLIAIRGWGLKQRGNGAVCEDILGVVQERVRQLNKAE